LSIEDFRAACWKQIKKEIALVIIILASMYAGASLGFFLLLSLTGSDVIADPQWYHFAVPAGSAIL